MIWPAGDANLHPSHYHVNSTPPSKRLRPHARAAVVPKETYHRGAGVVEDQEVDVTEEEHVWVAGNLSCATRAAIRRSRRPARRELARPELSGV